ncbi:TadE/TadG family type IV pilus assembly protein [Streptomyces sp. NBC_01216]|uniref:TadE/TadG family type IV pilus assembly protein n=1 Tax=unclassified Streptomyces TaxID=2593676 RepID=UPI002E116BC6|nr:pilus assembly protein [Streptomyces sp. NBC_01216]
MTRHTTRRPPRGTPTPPPDAGRHDRDRDTAARGRARDRAARDRHGDGTTPTPPRGGSPGRTGIRPAAHREARPSPRGTAPGGPRTRPARDRGQVAVEYLGFLPVLLLVALAGIQLGLASYAAQQAGTGARAAARAATRHDFPLDPRTAGRSAMSDWIAERSDVAVVESGNEAVATVTVGVPSVVPFWDFGDVSKSATMPLPQEDAP